METENIATPAETGRKRSVNTETHVYPSYAQAGEDRIIFSLFRELGEESRPIRYLDIGAAAPSGHNNTYLFYTLGGSGVLVEADSEYLPAYNAIRPRDAVENLAIVPKRLYSPSGIEFYAMEDKGRSTILPDDSVLGGEASESKSNIKRTVPCATILDILGKYFENESIDILSIDIEGVDQEIIREIDYNRFRPKTIIYEFSVGAGELSDLLPDIEFYKGIGYEIYAFTRSNVIFADKTVLARI